MADKIIIIKTILGAIAALGAIATITLFVLSSSTGDLDEVINIQSNSNDDDLIPEACSEVELDPVMISYCHSLTCKFSTSQCTNECPFGFVLDIENCPASCKCASSGLQQGDISFTAGQLPGMLELYGYVEESDVVSVFAGNVVKNESRKYGNIWPKDSDGLVKVRYFFDPGVTLNTFQEGVDWFEKNTCIRFIKKDSRANCPRPCIQVYHGKGCSAALGMIDEGSQSLSLDPAGCDYVSTVIHELLHALGLHHEQVRPDRDDHVYVAFENIGPDKYVNFRKLAWEHVYDLGMPYDLKSVMHYSSKSFAKPGTFAITNLNAPKEPIPQVMGLARISDIDITEINTAYKCDDPDLEHKVATTPAPAFTTAKVKMTTPEVSDGTGWMNWGPWSRMLQVPDPTNNVFNKKGIEIRWRGCKTFKQEGSTCYDPKFFEGRVDYIGFNAFSEEKFGEWSEFYPCVPRARLCEGTAVRFRDFIPGSAIKDGELQRWNLMKMYGCKIKGCTVGTKDGIQVPLFNQWGAWLPTNKCSVTCGGGTQQFRRQCRNQDGKVVTECGTTANEEFQDGECNAFSCDAPKSAQSSPLSDDMYGWAAWARWNKCVNGEQTRYRICKGAEQGQKCPGQAYDTRKCISEKAQKDQQYTTWGEWGDCLLPETTSCAGAKYRYRTCLRTNKCDMKGTTEMKACYRCSHGEIKWTPWKNSECSATCQGSMRRKRDCIDLSTKKASSRCVGNKEETVPCNTQSCDSKLKRLPTVFAVESTETKTTPCHDETSQWVFGDFNGDKKVEAICTGTSGNLQLMGLIGDKNLGSTLWTGTLYDCMGDDVIKYAADINGDEVDDLICKRANSGLYHIHLMMYGKFSTVPDYSTTLCGEGETPTFLNLNGDLRNDALCWNKQSGKMNIFINQITG